MTKKTDDFDKIEKRRKKLAKRLKKDVTELLELTLVRGDLTPEALGELLEGLGKTVSRTRQVHGDSKHLRKAGRFLENLHKEHQKVIAEGQFEKEAHDRNQLIRVKKMAKKGMKAGEIARILRKDGERVTADAIRRVLKKEK